MSSRHNIVDESGTIDVKISPWFVDDFVRDIGLQLNIADDFLRGMAQACRRSKTLRRL